MTSMSSITTANDGDSASSRRDTWSAESGATETMTSKREAFENYKDASKRGIQELQGSVTAKQKMISLRGNSNVITYSVSPHVR